MRCGRLTPNLGVVNTGVLRCRCDRRIWTGGLDWRVKGVLQGLLSKIPAGTGWLPVLPLRFALSGARRVHTFDLNRHLNRGAVPGLLQRLGGYLGALALASGQSEANVRERHAHRLGRSVGVVGLLQQRARTRRHIGVGLMGETKRLLTPHGLALHSVNYGDHYAYFDRSITPLNYLRFTDRQWQRWNNNLLYQNRLRPSDFTAAARNQGLTVVHQIQTERRELLARIPQDQIAPEFRHCDAQDLCPTSVTFAARPPTYA